MRRIFYLLSSTVLLASVAVSCKGSLDDPDYTLNVDSAVVYISQASDDAAYDMAQLSLVCGDLIETNGSYSGQGTALLLDMNISKGATYVQGGTYICNDGVEDFIFIPGSYSSAEQAYYPSYVYERNESMRTGEYYLVRDGKAVIKRNGDRYTVDASVSTNNGIYRFSYYGKFTDGSGSGSGGEEEGDFPDIDLSALVQGQAGYYGSEVWLDSNGNVIKSDYSDWMLYLVEKGVDLSDDSASMLQLDVLAKKTDVTSISTGTYNVVSAVTTENCLYFNAVAGYIDDDGYYQGCYYFDETNERYYRIEEGTIKIGKSGNNYTFGLDLKDTDHNARVTGNFTASLSIFDGTKEQNSESVSIVSVNSVMRRLAAPMPFRRQTVSYRQPGHSNRSFAPRR